MKTSLSRRLSFVFALLLATCVHAGSTGVVVSSSGSASIVSAEGKTRSAKAGSEIKPGDKLVTGDEGKLNVKFSDDSQVQLHARSQFRIDQYQSASKNDENAKGFFILLKGGFRTVTGLLGKHNREACRVTTSMALTSKSVSNRDKACAGTRSPSAMCLGSLIAIRTSEAATSFA